MKIFHGTGDCSLDSFLHSAPRKYPRAYVPRMRAGFSCTTSFEEAVKFALRRTPANDLTKVGVVLEFDVSPEMIEGKDCLYCSDPHSFIDEKEIMIFNVKKIKLVAVHKFKKDNEVDCLMVRIGYPVEDWKRESI